MLRLCALPLELTSATLARSCRAPYRSFTATSIRRTEKPYYVTTPIYYVNASPHIGHLYSSVLADILARWARLRHPARPVVFSTGTDEHGLKIERAAKSTDADPWAFCDRVSAQFKKLADDANVSYTTFIRTTEQRHADAVQHLWTELVKRGHIYKGKHAGWYSVSDECFYGEAQLEDVEGSKVVKESGQPVEWAEEVNYMFRLSAFREPLLDWLKSNPSLIQPSARYKEVLDYLSDPANTTDLSVSRPRERLTWGVRVPGNSKQTVYVWLDALTNYLTVTGYPWPGGVEEGRTKGWPADVLVVGKDIVKFHAIYFPAFLLALSLPPPTQILAHAHWTMDRRKMSKSRGNVADPIRAMTTHGVDTVRLYLAVAGGGLADDADWSDQRLGMFYRTLANTIGNLISRIASPKWDAALAHDNGKGELPPTSEPEDRAIKETLSSAAQKVERHMADMQVGLAAGVALQCIAESNEHLAALKPWMTFSPPLVRRAHFYAFESLRISAILLQPFMPTKATEILDVLGIRAEERGFEQAKLGAAGPLAGRRVKLEGSMFPKRKEAVRPPTGHPGQTIGLERLFPKRANVLPPPKV